MSERTFKSQASSGRAGGGFGTFGNASFGSTQSSVLSYIQEPPDYSLISDANLVPAFKNLTKKDSTTKAKALEDLQSSLISSDRDLEDAVVEAWVKLYPRLSIDNARRVRQLAHILNGQICSKCGKRVAKHLPRISGPWLAGTFDVDRLAAKAAQDALSTVFPSPEKIQGLRKTFHQSILEYCRDALVNETVSTLSDERTVSTDDAQATYARVMSTSIAVVTSLLETLPSDEVEKQSHLYEEILGDAKVWEFAAHDDPSVRRAVHRLVQVCLKRQPSLVESNVKTASKAYVYKGLSSDQASSAVDFVQTLDALTTALPTIWTDAYSGKKSAISRLQQSLKRGAHGGPSGYWDVMKDVFRKLPKDVLPKSQDEATDLFLAARDGVSKREERFNASAAWPAYFTLVDIVTSSLPDETAETLLEEFALPPVNQYIHPQDENAKWSITGARSALLVSKVALIGRVAPLLERKWQHLADKLVELAKMSQPEQSKDFDKSQKHVAAAGQRYADLQRELYAEEYHLPSSTKDAFAAASLKILQECIALLKARQGKPYGAAAIIEGQLRANVSQLMSGQGFQQTLKSFVTNDLAHLMYSPSQRHLARCLYATGGDAEFEKIFQATLQSVLDAEESTESKLRALHAMFPTKIPQKAADLARKHQGLQDYIGSQHFASDDTATLTLLSDLLKTGVVSQQTTDTVLSGLTESLSLSDANVQSSLAAVEQLALTDQSSVRTFMETDAGKQLLPNVLHLEQSPDDAVAEKATSLSGRLSSAMGNAATNAKYSIILQNLETVSHRSLNIDAVLELLEKVSAPTSDVSTIQDMLPSTETWRKSTLAIMSPPKASLSLLSPLGGAVHLVRSDAANTYDTAHYDGEGLSQALRIAIYMAKILNQPGVLKQLGDDAVPVLALLNICVLLAEDNTSILGANGLWLPAATIAFEDEVMEFVSNANAALRQYWESIGPASVESPFFGVLDDLKKQAQSDSPMAYYAMLASTKAYDNVFELHGYSTDATKASDESLKSLKSAKDSLALTSFLVGHAQPLAGSQALTRLFNELVADLTELSVESGGQRTFLTPLIVLNSILHTQEDIVDKVQKTRLIFLVKHIVPWLGTDMTLASKAEVCKALSLLLPAMSDTYGEHWSQITEWIPSFWKAAEMLSDGNIVAEQGIILVHSSLKLYTALNKLTKEDEPNDDLMDAVKENKDQIFSGLIEVLKSANGISDETHQPMMVTNELIARELSRMPFQSIADAEELFPLMYTPSHAIQGAAFDLLHRQIPTGQEQISFDAALDDKTAQLPDELLSLIIDAPTLDSLADASFDRAMPLQLQGFLNSWRLTFDHFTNSSYRVKSDYVEQLKEGGYLPGLLDLIFDFLGHTRGKPVDASKFNVQQYEDGMEPEVERDVQWLLSHLYYLALSNVPSLVKGYFLEIRSRQTTQAIESWTAKYIAPLIIDTSLQGVANWAEKSVKDDPDYENMTVRVGMRSKEINVSYLVDEQTMAIKVILPETYPLDSAKVVSVNRVAVKEEKWQSWLRNCQGVITFSNGSITDGLTAWRKNVIGALKGQTECAICYSIISGDKQLPTKRCPTCKNLFHSSCLLKWFKTSNASTCPLCRNPFNFN
ncbi:hypothetical protein PRZ48_010845 [Zasmidium cellare]|uniref:E3 ubiquitin-protein ligase listerin n=1 Tax=Zasmidium cellare TaxID=395010 RepID=A0ABR0EA62_ZASCE|nr:hypothetical protein PRZ48_010845 [Zasmidium cellare]